MAEHVTLLGFAAEEHAEALGAALAEIPGPDLRVVTTCGLAAIAQRESKKRPSLLRLGADATLRKLLSVQRRLERACLIGPFLPADRGESLCLATEILPLLTAAADGIGIALKQVGRCHQWDVILRWQPEDVIAARRDDITAAGAPDRLALAEAVSQVLSRERALREAALRLALSDVVIALLPAGSGTAETGMTVLLPAGGEAVLETVLCGLAPDITAGATADLRGPLPPISFAGVRVVSAAPAEVAKAWHRLSLPETVNAVGLRRHYHSCAARLHPDHGAQETGPMSEAVDAFRLLKNLLPGDAPEASWSLHALQRRGALRLVVPPAVMEMRA
jgi:hypothetical protein